ncbi:hypothetical protein BC831DRAFT_451771 [Entophlyctis helioformis]|nr:hypothetical protein BC831DRAFT_451771 [Entophlyctis helioformis]
MSGYRVSATTVAGKTYEGIKLYSNNDTDVLSLRQARLVAPNDAKGANAVIPSLEIPNKDLLCISCLSIEAVPLPKPSDNHHSGFKTDTGISGGSGPQRERELKRWTPGEDDTSTFVGLEENTGRRRHWDQFATNERLFGVKTDFQEELYTTVLDKDTPDFSKREAEAKLVAAEIMNSATEYAHVAEERGQVSKGGAANMDEEDKYSSVLRQPGKYVPPGARRNEPPSPIPSQAAAPSGKPAPSSTSTSASQDSRKESSPLDAKTTPKQTPGASSTPAAAATYTAVAANKITTKSEPAPGLPPPAAGATKRVPPESGGDTFARIVDKHQPKTLAADGRNPPVEKCLDEFKGFVADQKKVSKQNMFNELKQFGKTLKLKEPMPSDLQEILKKDKKDSDSSASGVDAAAASSSSSAATAAAAAVASDSIKAGSAPKPSTASTAVPDAGKKDAKPAHASGSSTSTAAGHTPSPTAASTAASAPAPAGPSTASAASAATTSDAAPTTGVMALPKNPSKNAAGKQSQQAQSQQFRGSQQPRGGASGGPSNASTATKTQQPTQQEDAASISPASGQQQPQRPATGPANATTSATASATAGATAGPSGVSHAQRSPTTHADVDRSDAVSEAESNATNTTTASRSTAANFKFNLMAAEFTPSSTPSSAPSFKPPTSDNKPMYGNHGHTGNNGGKRGGKSGPYMSKPFNKPFQPKGSSPKAGAYSYDQGAYGQAGDQQMYGGGHAYAYPQQYHYGGAPGGGRPPYPHGNAPPNMSMPPGSAPGAYAGQVSLYGQQGFAPPGAMYAPHMMQPGGPPPPPNAMRGRPPFIHGQPPMYPGAPMMPGYAPEMMGGYQPQMMMPGPHMGWVPDQNGMLPDGTMMPSPGGSGSAPGGEMGDAAGPATGEMGPEMTMTSPMAPPAGEIPTGYYPYVPQGMYPGGMPYDVTYPSHTSPFPPQMHPQQMASMAAQQQSQQQGEDPHSPQHHSVRPPMPPHQQHPHQQHYMAGSPHAHAHGAGGGPVSPGPMSAHHADATSPAQP